MCDSENKNYCAPVDKEIFISLMVFSHSLEIITSSESAAIEN